MEEIFLSYYDNMKHMCVTITHELYYSIEQIVKEKGMCKMSIGVTEQEIKESKTISYKTRKYIPCLEEKTVRLSNFYKSDTKSVSHKIFPGDIYVQMRIIRLP